jgi:N-acetyltransferase
MSFDLQPILRGEFLELRPLQPADFHGLYAVASDPLIWEQHPNKDRYKEEVSFKFVNSVLFPVGPQNLRSQRAMEKIGGVRAGSRPDANGRDSFVYQITAST